MAEKKSKPGAKPEGWARKSRSKGSPSVLFVAFEAVPFAKTGGLGDVAGSLPKELNKLGADVRLIMPKFGTIPEEYKKKIEHVAYFYMELSWRRLYVGVEKLVLGGVTVYFIDNEDYFKRDNIYGYGDDWERAAYFSKAVLAALPYTGFQPDIIHCNDWHTSLVPAFLKLWYGKDKRFPYAKIKTVFTVHNLKFQGWFGGYITSDGLGISWDEAWQCGMVYGGDIKYMKSALEISDRITTVSPTYAKEICTPQYGEGCEEIFVRRNSVLSGILNGIDTEVLDPASDKNLPVNYGADDYKAGKAAAKAALQERLGLEKAPDKPLYAIISRLTDQKGLDLVNAVIDEFMEEDVQFAVLGVGSPEYENKFKELAEAMPSKFGAAIYFDEPLSRLIYAGADFMLVPSLFEPCGLTQITAMRYGTIPIVRSTGGLADTVNAKVGFSFKNYDARELLETMKAALDVYGNRKKLDTFIKNDMKQDYSWGASAEKYLSLYKELV